MAEGPNPPSAFGRWFEFVQRIVLGVLVTLAVATMLTSFLKLAVAPQLRIFGFGAMALLLLTGVIGEILERRKLLPKDDSRINFEDPELPPLRPEPIPIAEAAVLDPDSPAPEPLEKPVYAGVPPVGGILPEAFSRGGARAVWRVQVDDWRRASQRD